MKNILIMRKLCLLVFAIAPLALAAQQGASVALPAADAGWARVMNLAVGDTIAVRASRLRIRRCTFVAADDSSVTCDRPAFWGMGGGEFSFPRGEVLEIHRRSPLLKALPVGAGMVGGAYLGAASGGNPDQRAVLAVLCAAAFGYFGWVVGDFANITWEIAPVGPIYRKP